METGRIVPGPKKVQFPKRVKVPELENWYRFQYDEHNAREDEDRRRYSLAHIMYEITGCIMPRNLDRYLPALMILDRCGINGKRTIHDVRVRYFSYASAQKCAEQIVADEKAMNK